MAEYIERNETLRRMKIDVRPPFAVVRDMPAADVVEVKRGRWEYLQDDEWRCSNCHTVFNTGGKWIPMTDNFCSECGADMRERRENDG